MLLIRHAEKHHKNNSSYKHRLDSNILPKESKKIFPLCKKLMQHFVPEEIRCSPYLRTRKTAILLQKELLYNYNLNIPVVIDLELSEYLGNQKGKITESQDFTRETLEYGYISPETEEEFKNRVCSYPKCENSWIITHGYFIYTLTGVYPKFLAYTKL